MDEKNVNLDASVVRWALKFACSLEPVIFTGWMFLYLFSAVLPTVFMMLVSRIIDSIQENVAAGNGIESISVTLIALVVVMFVDNLFFRIPNLMWAGLSTRYSVWMQRKMGEFMRRVPIRYFDDGATARMMSMAQKKENSFGNFIADFFSLAANLFALASMAVLAWQTSWTLLVVMAVFLCVAVALGNYNAKQAYVVWADESQNERIAGYYSNLVFKSAPKEVRLLKLQDYILKKWRERMRPVVDTYIKSRQREDLRWQAMDMIITVTKVVMLCLGLYLLQKGQLTLGGLTVFVSVFEQVGSTTMTMGYNWMNVCQNGQDLQFKKNLLELHITPEPRTCCVATDRSDSAGDPASRSDFSMRGSPVTGHRVTSNLLEWDMSVKRPLHEREKDVQPKKTDENMPIEFELKNVSFAYDKINAIDHLSLKIHKGETVAIVGENGAGKSTLIKLLLGLYEPQEGELYFEGKSYQKLDMNQMADRIGIVFQDFVRFELTARENVAFGDISKVQDDGAIRRAMEMGGAVYTVDRLPKGMDTYLGRWYEKEGGNMSGGEWQRIAVSRAHISERDFLIMDEPAAALDPIAEMEQFAEIKKSLHDRPAVVMSHRIGCARLADRIFVLQDGRMAEAGSHEELMEKKGIYYAMFRNQAEWYQKV